MSWHEDLGLEIAVEFRRLEGGWVWLRAEELCFIRNEIKRCEFRASRRWFRKTTWGKRAHCRSTKQRRERLKGVVRGYSKCSVCGDQYERHALARKTRTTCSRSCATTKRNASTAHFVTIDGVTRSMSAMARHYGLSQPLVHHRIHKLGWDVRRALTTPARKKAVSALGYAAPAENAPALSRGDIAGTQQGNL